MLSLPLAFLFLPVDPGVSSSGVVALAVCGEVPAPDAGLVVPAQEEELVWVESAQKT